MTDTPAPQSPVEKSTRRNVFRKLDPDHKKWFRILIVVALFAYPMWLVGKHRCGWLFGVVNDPAQQQQQQPQGPTHGR